MQQSNYNRHTLSLCTLFVLGNAIVFLPSNNNLWCVLTVLFFPLTALLVGTTLVSSFKNKFLLFLTSAIICITAVLGAVTTFADYVLFLKNYQLEDCSLYLTSVVFIGIVLFFAFCDNQAFYKYCLFTATICLAIIIICFLSGLKNFSLSNLDTKAFKTFAFFDVFKTFLPVVVLPFFVNFSLKNKKHHPFVFAGVITGVVLSALCLLQALLTLNITDKTIYPYLEAVSIISSGSLFTRLDGLICFLFFTTALTKITVCTKTVLYVLKQIKKPKFQP